MSSERPRKLAAGLALASTLLFAPTVSAWTVTADFESGALGEKANGDDGFSEAFKYSVYSDAFVHTGSQAGEVGVDQGTDGFGDWGGSFGYPDLQEGEEIWFRIYVYFPTGFDFSCTQCAGLKMMRIHTANQNAGNEGYFDVLIDGGGLNVASEITPDYFMNNPNWKNLGTPVSTGEWMAVEQYVLLSSVPGQGIYRAWQDGVLIKEDLQTNTLRSSTSMSDFAYLFTYWNGSAPATQVAYVDDVHITNETPSALDAAGNAFIGLTDMPPGTGSGGAGGGTTISGSGSGGNATSGSGGSGVGGSPGAGGDNTASGEDSESGSGCSVTTVPAPNRAAWVTLLLAGVLATRRRRARNA